MAAGAGHMLYSSAHSKALIDVLGLKEQQADVPLSQVPISYVYAHVFAGSYMHEDAHACVHLFTY